MSSSTTKRTSLIYGILGDTEIKAVSSGNTIAARVSLLLMVAVLRGVYWCALWLYLALSRFCNKMLCWCPTNANHVERSILVCTLAIFGYIKILQQDVMLVSHQYQSTCAVLNFKNKTTNQETYLDLFARRYLYHAQVEQPSSSVLRQCPYLCHVLTTMGPNFSKRMWMGTLGHWCAKPSQLFGNWWLSW